MKVLPAIFALVLAVSFGKMSAKRLYNREKILNGLMQDVRLIGAQMEYMATPMFEVMHNKTLKHAELWSNFACELNTGKDYQTAWQASVKRYDSGVMGALIDTDLSVLADFALGLCAATPKGQGENAALAEKRLAYCINEANAQAAKKGKVYESLGVLFGLAFALLLF